MGKNQRRNRLPLHIDADAWDKVRECRGKQPFPTRKVAKQAAAVARRRSGHGNIEEFKCRFGDKKHYHIGHAKNGKPKQLSSDTALAI